MGQRPDAPEEVQFEARHADAEIVLADDLAAAVTRQGRASGAVHDRQLLRMLNVVLLARRCDVRRCGQQVPVVRKRKTDQTLQARILKYLLVCQDRQTSL